MGLPAYRIQKALNKWKVELLADDLYRFTKLDDPDLKLILDSFGITIPIKLFRKTDLKSQIKNINMGIWMWCYFIKKHNRLYNATFVGL